MRDGTGASEARKGHRQEFRAVRMPSVVTIGGSTIAIPNYFCFSYVVRECSKYFLFSLSSCFCK